jgi:Zn-dependent peptidase ImmA (M78 family)
MQLDILLFIQILSPGRGKEELQVDIFAAYILMPKKQIKELFDTTDLTERSHVNKNTTFNLTKDNITKLRLEVNFLSSFQNVSVR